MTRCGEPCPLPRQSSRGGSRWLERPSPPLLRGHVPAGLQDVTPTPRRLSRRPSPSPADGSACPPKRPRHLVPVSVTVLATLLGGRGAGCHRHVRLPTTAGPQSARASPRRLRSPLLRREPGHSGRFIHVCFMGGQGQRLSLSPGTFFFGGGGGQEAVSGVSTVDFMA